MKSLKIESATDPLIKKKNDNEIIILPVNDVHFSKVVSYLDFVGSCKVIVYLFAKDFYFLTRAIICAAYILCT